MTDAKGVATPGTDDVGGPKSSQLSELRRTANWHEPPEEVREEDDLVSQSAAARFNFLAMDRPDLSYSVKELMQKKKWLHHVLRTSLPSRQLHDTQSNTRE